MEPADEDVVGEKSDMTVQLQTVAGKADLRPVRSDLHVDNRFGSSLVPDGGYDGDVAGELRGLELPDHDLVEGGRRVALSSGARYLQPVQEPGQVTVADQGIVGDINPLDRGKMVEGTELDCFDVVVVQLQPLELVETRESVHGEDGESVVREVQEPQEAEIDECFLCYVDNVIVAQINFFQIFDSSEEVLLQRLEAVVVEVELESVGGQTGGKELLIPQLDAVDLYSLLEKTLYSLQSLIYCIITDLYGSVALSVHSLLVTEAAGRAVVSLGQSSHQADHHHHQHGDHHAEDLGLPPRYTILSFTSGIIVTL